MAEDQGVSVCILAIAVAKVVYEVNPHSQNPALCFPPDGPSPLAPPFIWPSCILYAEPGAPGVLTVGADKTSVTLSWEPPSSPNGRLLEYEVSYSGYKEDEARVCIVWSVLKISPFFEDLHALMFNDD